MKTQVSADHRENLNDVTCRDTVHQCEWHSADTSPV